MSLGMYTKRRVEFVRMRGPNVRISRTRIEDLEEFIDICNEST